MLLLNLDAATAAELLRAAKPDTITEIAAELAHLHAQGAEARRESAGSVREFMAMLSGKKTEGPGAGFVQGVLEGALGKDRARELSGRVSDLLERRDPFMIIRSVEPERIARVIQGESPQVAAMVLGELPRKNSAKLLALLDENVRAEAVRGMVVSAGVDPATKQRVARMLRDRLEPKAGAVGGGVESDEKLRKVAMLVRGLGNEIRNSMMEAIRQQDVEAAKNVQRLMVIWEDVPSVADRSLQEALREMDARQIALSLWGADAGVVQKVRTNMSERAVAMLDEETSLLSSHTDEEIHAARETFLGVLRELVENGMLSFQEG